MSPSQKTRDFMLWWIVPGGLVLAAAFFRLDDPDMWWHLAGGRMILDGQFPLSNTFSHSFPDYPWRFTQWLFGTLIALAEKLGGFVAVQAVVGAFAVGIFLLLIATIRRDVPQARWFLVLPLIALGAISTRFRFDPRGDIATLLGLAAVHYLWVLRPKRLPLFLFLAACLWSNLHAGVVFGILEIGIFGCAAVLDRDRKSIRDALFCGAAFFAGSLVNPFFHYPYLYILENYEVARHFPMRVLELNPPSWQDPRFAALVILAVLGVIPALVRRRYRDVLLIAGSGAMAFSAIRFVPFIAVLSLPGVARSFHDYREILAARCNAKAAGALLAAPVLAAAFYVGSVDWKLDPPGFGANLRIYPAGAADFILSKGFTGRMFNEFNQGGFLAWKLYPRQRVFIDGRGNAYPWDHFKQAAGYSSGTTAEILAAYGIDFAVVERHAGDVDLGTVFAAMGWDLVHVEGIAFLFVRPGSPDAMRARAEVFRSFVPGAASESLFQSARENPSQVHSELTRIDPRSLLRLGDFNLFGMCAQITGDSELALRFLEAGLESFPDEIPLRMNHAFVLNSLGRTGEAAEQYRRIVEEHPESEFAMKAKARLEAIRTAPPWGGGPVR